MLDYVDSHAEGQLLTLAFVLLMLPFCIGLADTSHVHICVLSNNVKHIRPRLRIYLSHAKKSLEKSIIWVLKKLYPISSLLDSVQN